MKQLDQLGRYATVVIDPPWQQGSIGLSQYARNLTYATMSVDDIAALPVGATLDDDAFLFVWAVNKHLGDAIGLLDIWGVKYSFTMTWVKSKGAQYPGGPSFNAEWIIVGRKGSPAFRDTRAFTTANYWPMRGHSEKPDGFYDLLRRITEGPRLDVFGRRSIAGFESWGDEAPEGEALPEHYQQVLI